MKTLLVLAPHPDVVEVIRSGLDSEAYRLVPRPSLDDVEPLLVHGLVDGCILDLELMTVQGVWALEKLRSWSAHCPIIIYVGTQNWEWEEEAYLKGANYVLSKPIRPKTLATILGQLWSATPKVTPLPPPAAPLDKISVAEPSYPLPRQSVQALTVLRSFSAVLTHSLHAESMLKEFLLLLREILSINRAAIFFKPSLTSAADLAAHPEDQMRLRNVSSVGISSGLLQHFELSFDAGIGAQVRRLGRVLRRQSEEARQDQGCQKEFELLGTQVAVPVLDRDSVIGVAVFDGHITGEPLSNPELELIFRLLEQLGLAMKNIWLHDQLATNHELMLGIMRELSNACIVVSRNLSVVHANKMARKFFMRADRRASEMEFSDLPQTLGAKVYQVLNTGSALSDFKYEPEGSPGTVYNVSIIPFQRPTSGLPSSVLLMAEDLTQIEHYKRLEIEAAKARQLKHSADRLTAELGNAMVRPMAYQQLLRERLSQKSVDLESLKSMDKDLADDFSRIRRLVNQLRYLNAESIAVADLFPIAALLEEALQEARKHQTTSKSPTLSCEGLKGVNLKGDRNALRLAFTEVLLNCIQANTSEPKIWVRGNPKSNGEGMPGLLLEFEDNGPGFSPEALQKATTPFYTTKVVGIGLGLTIAQKILEGIGGKLEVAAPTEKGGGVVRISLPAQVATA
jgi:nitrogen-specific signal transduction histidine kinase/DNA-binding response OmpR family regulator